MMSIRMCSIVTLVGLAAGCGDDPVTYSEPVGIELKAEFDKVVNGTLSEDKEINTESGNPYGAFVTSAEAALDGLSPTAIDVESVTVAIGASSEGVTRLGEVFDGRFEVLFEINDTDDTFAVASADIDEEIDGGPFALDTDLDEASISDENYERLLNGSFRVVYRAPAHVDFAGSGAKADLQVTFTFVAFE